MENIFSTVILFEIVMKYIAILLTFLLTISITSCVFYALCSIIFISKQKEKWTFLKIWIFNC